LKPIIRQLKQGIRQLRHLPMPCTVTFSLLNSKLLGMKLIKLFGIAVLALGVTMTSCSIEDGKDGIDGIDGRDGQDGLNGADGQDGADGADGVNGLDGAPGQDGIDGLGLEELAKYGFITLELSGTRPDNLPFEDSASYRFSPIDPDDFDIYNIVTITQVGNDTEYFFNFRRFLSSPEGTYTINYMDWELTVVNLGQETESVGDVVIALKHGVIGDDYKYFMINDEYESGGAGISEMTFTDLAFDPNAGNHLSFSYAFTVNGANNSSGNDLSISGMVDVNLLELIP